MNCGMIFLDVENNHSTDWTKHITTIIFDFDDTLIHSGETVNRAVFATAEKLNLPKPSIEAISSCRGFPLPRTLEVLWPFAENSLALKTYLEVYNYDEVKMVEGADETIHKLQEKGFSLHILSSKRILTLSKQLQVTGLSSHLFSSIIGADMVSYHKPDPRVFTSFLRQYKASEMMYVGDSIHDSTAAKKAGIAFVGVLTGGETEENFRRRGAMEIIKSIRELPAFLHVPKKPHSL